MIDNKLNSSSKWKIITTLCPLIKVINYLPESKNFFHENIEYVELLVKSMHSLQMEYRRENIAMLSKKLGKERLLKLLNLISPILPGHLRYNIKESIDYLKSLS